MRLLIVPCVALMLVASCSAPDPFARTEIGRKRLALSQGLTLHDTILNPERDTSSAALLGDAAFELTQGMDADQATRTFVADGASCSGATCVWTYRLREAAFPCGLPPISLVSMCIRQPGPRRSFERRYEVTLLNPTILERSDISAAAYGRVLPGETNPSD